MGLRIKKEMGFICSESIDIDSLSKISILDLKKEFPNDRELNRLDLMYPNLDLTMKLSQMVSEISEEGSSKTYFLLKPPNKIKNWKRSDDDIDYFDSNGIPKLKIKYIHTQVFPYHKNMIISNSLKELTNLEYEDLKLISSGIELKKEKEVLKKKGIDFSKKIKNQIHMIPPRIIELILIKGGAVFPKKAKFGIITYWD